MGLVTVTSSQVPVTSFFQMLDTLTTTAPDSELDIIFNIEQNIVFQGPLHVTGGENTVFRTVKQFEKQEFEKLKIYKCTFWQDFSSVSFRSSVQGEVRNMLKSPSMLDSPFFSVFQGVASFRGLSMSDYVFEPPGTGVFGSGKFVDVYTTPDSSKSMER